jgi:hypothetical protein
MDGWTKDATGHRAGVAVLSLWITAAACAAWAMLWLVSGNFASSFVVILASMILLVARLSERRTKGRETELLAAAVQLLSKGRLRN